jgi:addiction module HigA family antidote
MIANFPMRTAKSKLNNDENPGAALHPRTALYKKMGEYNLSAAALAGFLGVPTNRITEILNMRRTLTADTALRLAIYFGTTPKHWLDMQQAYEIAMAEADAGEKIRRTVTPRKG